MVVATVLAALGLAELLRPRKTVDAWLRLAVTPDSDVELRPWVYTAARVEGALLLLWAIRARRRSRD